MDSIKFHKDMRRIRYYAGSYVRYYLPDFLARMPLARWAHSLPAERLREIEERVEYCCRLPEGSSIDESNAICAGDFRFGERDPQKGTRHSGYFFDLYPFIRRVAPDLKFAWLPEDVAIELSIPTIVKSRPITTGTTNNVICRLNSLRHFFFVRDPYSYDSKVDIPVSRNAIGGRPWRAELLTRYIKHPGTDFGAVDCADSHPEWQRPFMSIRDQLRHKFVLTLQGNDVATNLKWVMSSNSIAVMPRPTIESWYMEGRLLPDVHYIEIAPDYSNLFERLDYFLTHPAEAKEIICNAHRWVDRFRDNRIEALAMAGVVDRYFKQTGQLR